MEHQINHYFCTNNIPPVKFQLFLILSAKVTPFDESYQLRAIDLHLKIDGVRNVGHMRLAMCDRFVHIWQVWHTM